MSPTKAMHDNPMNWKDWVTAAGLTLTLATLFIQGGRLVERQEATNITINKTSEDVTQIGRSLVLMQLEVASMKGVDAVRAEQINALRNEMASLKSQAAK